jgi:ubiquinone/menaquinone biosynthesis C-methylase UbiE
MAVNNHVHSHEHGLPLNTTEWLEIHHQCKEHERKKMIQDLHIRLGSFVVDAGCGPGLWIPLLVQAAGPQGYVLGIDMSPDALITAQRDHAQTQYRQQIQFKRSMIDQLPLAHRSVDLVFSANVSQYLPDPVATFATIGPFLKEGGRLVVKDIDYSTLHFTGLDPALQDRVFQARYRWEQDRSRYGYAFEDSWVGSKLAGYLSTAGYKDVQECRYPLIRTGPLSEIFLFYLRGVAEWFISEDAPYLAREDGARWLDIFTNHISSIVQQSYFAYTETEYVVSGVWK